MKSAPCRGPARLNWARTSWRGGKAPTSQPGEWEPGRPRWHWNGVKSGYLSYRSKAWSRRLTTGPAKIQGSVAGYHQEMARILSSGTRAVLFSCNPRSTRPGTAATCPIAARSYPEHRAAAVRKL